MSRLAADRGIAAQLARGEPIPVVGDVERDQLVRGTDPQQLDDMAVVGPARLLPGAAIAQDVAATRASFPSLNSASVGSPLGGVTSTGSQSVSGIASRPRARRVAGARRRVRVGHDKLALETIGVTEENAQDRAEVGDEVISRAAGHQPGAKLLESRERRGLQARGGQSGRDRTSASAGPPRCCPRSERR